MKNDDRYGPSPEEFSVLRIDINSDGYITVLFDDQPWTPLRSSDPSAPLQRSDVPRVLDEVLAVHDVPVDVTVHDDGQTYTHVLVPEQYQSGSARSPKFGDGREYQEATSVTGTSPAPRPGLTLDGFRPGEPVALAVAVARVEADDDGRVEFRVPSALSGRVGDLLAHGVGSGLTIMFDDSRASSAAGSDPNRSALPGQRGHMGTPRSGRSGGRP